MPAVVFWRVEEVYLECFWSEKFVHRVIDFTSNVDCASRGY